MQFFYSKQSSLHSIQFFARSPNFSMARERSASEMYVIELSGNRFLDRFNGGKMVPLDHHLQLWEQEIVRRT